MKCSWNRALWAIQIALFHEKYKLRSHAVLPWVGGAAQCDGDTTRHSILWGFGTPPTGTPPTRSAPVGTPPTVGAIGGVPPPTKMLCSKRRPDFLDLLNILHGYFGGLILVHHEMTIKLTLTWSGQDILWTENFGLFVVSSRVSDFEIRRARTVFRSRLHACCWDLDYSTRLYRQNSVVSGTIAVHFFI
mgnify:CR=1 FL=1